MTPYSSPAVAAAFDAFPDDVRSRLTVLRNLVYEQAQALGTAPLNESLKWGQPSYASKRGTPIRLGFDTNRPGTCSVYVHCQTTLVETFSLLHPEAFEWVGTREVLVQTSGDIDWAVLRAFIGTALRYRDVKAEPLLGL